MKRYVTLYRNRSHHSATLEEADGRRLPNFTGSIVEIELPDDGESVISARVVPGPSDEDHEKR